MIGLLAILAAAGAIAMAEAPRLYKQRHLKELWVFSLLLLFATGFAAAASLHAPLPNPIDWIVYLFKPVNAFVWSSLR